MDDLVSVLVPVNLNITAAGKKVLHCQRWANVIDRDYWIAWFCHAVVQNTGCL